MMNNKERPRAEIDGKEIEVELMEDETVYGPRAYAAGNPWRLFVPVILTGLAIVSIVFLSATLFIWALPVILPVAIIWFIVRALR